VAGLIAVDVAPLAAAVHRPAMNILAGMAASIIVICSPPAPVPHFSGTRRATREEREAEPLPNQGTSN
jgi:hypothetical protein